MLKSGRQFCEDLDFVLSDAGVRSMCPQARRLVEEHVGCCRRCARRMAGTMSERVAAAA